MRDPPVEILLGAAPSVKILTRDEKSFHQERRFHQVPAVIEHAEHRHRLPGTTVHKVRPSPVIALCAFEKTDNLRDTLNPLFARDEPAIYADYKGGDAKPARSGCNDSVISGNVLAGHA